MKKKLRRKSCMMFLLIMLTSTLVSAQQGRTITGTVVDYDGVPVPAASVVIQGTTMGVITGEDGSYSIEVPASALNLIISFVGMTTVTAPIGDQTVLDIVLDEDALGLEEVVVVGYGVTKKATLTGSIVQVRGDDVLREKGTSSAAMALQGEIPGLTVTRGTSRPGNEDIDIKIRGDISVNGGSAPLIMIDGLEVGEWQLSTINSNDIESISVLKDGAGAIYGTKAAGGVILVTTKKGKSGKMKVEYLGDIQLNIPKEMPGANLKELADLWLLGGRNDMIDYVDTDGNPQTASFSGRFFSEDEWQMFSDGTMPLAPDSYMWGSTLHRFADEDYNDYIFGTTVSQRHSLALSGGNEKAVYRTSFGYSNDRSPMAIAYDGAKKFNFRTNLSYEVNDLISTEFNISYDYRIVDEPTHGIGEGLQNPSFYPIHNPQGQYYTLWGDHVPLELEEGGRTVNNQDLFRIGGALNLNLDKYIQGLSFRYQGNISTRNLEGTARTKLVTKYDWDGVPSTYAPAKKAVSQSTVNMENEFFQNHVVRGNYVRSFGNNNLALMAGVTWEAFNENRYELQRQYLLSDDLDALNTGSADTQLNEGYADHGALVSYISRLNYDYAGIYLLEVTARRDGSSRLHPDYRWKNFFNGSAGVRLSEISAIKNLDIFQNLKLRASWGETGSTSGIGLYDYISTMTAGSTYFGSSPSIYNTYRIASMTTTERTWERVSTTNFGLDFGVMNSRLRGTFEYFIRKNDDMLVSITYPEILGATAPKTNSGAFKTNGYELSLNWRDRIGDFEYNIGLSYWDSESLITRMEGAETINIGLNDAFATKVKDRNWVEGYPLQSIFVYETDGIFETEAEIYEYYEMYGFGSTSAGELDEAIKKSGSDVPAYRSADRLVPGCVKRIDQNGDGLINQLDDLVFHGDANPHHNFGIQLGFKWKGLDFYAFFQGVGQQYIVRTGTMAYPFRSWYMNQNGVFVDNTWTPDNKDAEWPMAFYNGQRKNWNFAHTNDVNVINARYMRAKVLTLGYTLPGSITNRANIDRVRLSVTANDLFVVSNIHDGLDPEHGSNAHNGGNYPFSTAVVFSLQVGF